MTCLYCHQRARWIRELCSLCAMALPYSTRNAYRAGHTDTRRVMELLRLRQTSAAVLGAGRHTR